MSIGFRGKFLLSLIVGVVGFMARLVCDVDISSGDMDDVRATRRDCNIRSTILLLLPTLMSFKLLPSFRPFLERGLSEVDVRPRVMFGEDDCLLDLSRIDSLVFDEVVDDGDGGFADDWAIEGLDDDDDDAAPCLNPPVLDGVPGLVLVGVPGLEGPNDGEDNVVRGLDETNNGDEDVPGLTEPMDGDTLGLPVPTEVPLELETERVPGIVVVLRFGGGSSENPGISDGCQAWGTVALTLGELPREVSVFLEGKELALLAEEDLPGADCP